MSYRRIFFWICRHFRANLIGLKPIAYICLSNIINMIILIKCLIGFIAFLHLYFLYLEMFAWTTRGPKVFKSLPKESFEATKVMAGNQGLYNGFLAAGLIWSLCISDMVWAKNVSMFFLICVAVAGLYGAMTASKRIFFIQALPAIIALILILIV